MDIGRSIIQLRTKRGLTQSQLAKVIGKSPSYITRLENGRETVNLDELSKLALHLNSDILNLIGSAMDEKDYPKGFTNEIKNFFKK